MAEALLMSLYVVLIVFVICLIVLVIRLINTLNKVDYLVDDLTNKSKSLDGLFSIIDAITSKANFIGESIASGFLAVASKLFGGKKRKKKVEEEEE